jgi:hypothetical protein
MTTKGITLTPRVKAALRAGSPDNLSLMLTIWSQEELRMLYQELRDSYHVARQELDDSYIADCKEFDPLLSDAGRALVAKRHQQARTNFAELFAEIESVIKSHLKEEEEKSA